MKRFPAFLVVLVLAAAFTAPRTHAAATTITLEVNKTRVAVGDTFVLTVKAAGVTDIYGSAIDVFFPAGKVEPLLPSATVTSTTAASGIVTQGSTSSYTATPSASGRQSLIALRLGNQPGASADGVLGQIEFKALATDVLSFAPDSQVLVQLVAADGTRVAFTFGGTTPAVQITETNAFTITAPASNAVLSSSSVAVAGFAPALAEFSLSLDGVAVTKQALPDATFSHTFSGVSDGVHTVSAVLGSSSTLTTFYVDTAPPGLSIDPITSITAPLPVTGTVSDANLRKVFVQVSAPGTSPGTPGSADEAAVNAAAGTYSKGINLLSGTSVITVTAQDVAGHTTVRSTEVVFYHPVLQLSAIPAKGNYQPGDLFDLTATMANVPENLGAMAAELVFDSRLEVLTTDSGTPMVDFTDSVLGPRPGGSTTGMTTLSDMPSSTSLRVNISNANGPNPGATLSFTVKMRVRSPAEDGAASIAFSPVPDTQQTGNGVVLQDSNGNVIPDSTTGGLTLQVRNVGAISGVLSLDGRHDSDYSGVEVQVWGNDAQPVAVRYTNADGSFAIGHIVPMSGYVVKLAKSPYLTVGVAGVNVSPNATTGLTDLGIIMFPGNVRDPAATGPAAFLDTIFLEDLAALARVWGTASGSSPEAARADLNGDGIVGSLDLTLMGRHWGKGGILSGNPSPGTFFELAVPR